MIVRTEAVVLRAMKYGETSQIVTLFTRDKGKLAVLAKGSRLVKSRFGSTLQPMSHTQVVFYYKPSRTLQTLTESAHVHAFHTISRDLDKITVGLRIVELVSALMPEEEANPALFDLLLQVLHRLDVSDVHLQNLLPYFQLRLATVLGFAPDVDRDVVQSLPDEGGVLILEDGSILPVTSAERTIRSASRTGSRTALRAFAIFARADLDAIMRMQLDATARREVQSLVDDFLRYHVEDAFPTRSDKVFDQLHSQRS